MITPHDESSQFFSRNGTTLTDFAYSIDDEIFLPKVGLIKEFGEDHTVGFTVQRAFRAGGAGAQFSTGEVFTFGPETAWNYELSYKGNLLDDRLKLSSNLFYLDLQDQQVEVLADPLDFRHGLHHQRRQVAGLWLRNRSAGRRDSQSSPPSSRSATSIPSSKTSPPTRSPAT